MLMRKQQFEKIDLIDAGALSGWLARARLKAVRPHLAGHVLDFACGHGQLAQFCDPAGYLGVDIDSRKIDIARQHFPGHRFEVALPAGERYDTIAALAFIEHVAPEPYLKQFAGLLRPGGKVVLTTPHPAYEWVHTSGARLHIFSPEAHDDHEDLLSSERMAELADSVSLRLLTSRRFLFGANQLFVLTLAAG
jgi:2-polyprenyl-3-methyl-5-hydroxy-6-metoxy-1,4-benzoquinol methylase